MNTNKLQHAEWHIPQNTYWGGGGDYKIVVLNGKLRSSHLLIDL